MAPGPDARRVVGARFRTKAQFATALAQAERYFRSLWNTTQVSGTALGVDTSKSKEKASTHLKVEWNFSGCTSVKAVNLRSAKLDDPPSTTDTPIACLFEPPLPKIPSVAEEDGAWRQGGAHAYKPSPAVAHPTLSGDNFRVVHDTKWLKHDVLLPDGGPTSRRPWSVCSCTVDTVVEMGDSSSAARLPPYDCFMMVLPEDKLTTMVHLTNVKIRALKQQLTSPRAVLEIISVLILETRYEFSTPASLWTTVSQNSLLDPPSFGTKTDLSRARSVRSFPTSDTARSLMGLDCLLCVIGRSLVTTMLSPSTIIAAHMLGHARPYASTSLCHDGMALVGTRLI